MRTGLRNDYSGDDHRDELQDQQWRELFRLQIQRRDHFTCQICGYSSRWAIQVHHDRYENRKKLYEADPKNCRTLCDPCHEQLTSRKKALQEPTACIRDIVTIEQMDPYIRIVLMHPFYPEWPDGVPLPFGFPGNDSDHEERQRRIEIVNQWLRIRFGHGRL